MSKLVHLPLRFLVIHSGHTARLAQFPFTSNLYNFCEERQIEPLFIHDLTNVIKPMQIITLRARPRKEQIETACTLLGRLNKENLQTDGIIAFNADDFVKIMETVNSLDELNYCKIRGMLGVQFLQNKYGGLDTAYVSINAEEL